MYVQEFDCEYISLKKSVHMFEHMEIIKIIFGCVVTPSYLKNTQPKSNRTGAISKKRGESAFSNTHPMTDGGAGK